MRGGSRPSPRCWTPTCPPSSTTSTPRSSATPRPARSSRAASPRSTASRARCCGGSASCSPAATTQSYVDRRWRVGWRHVEIGLDQVYTNVALSRLRTGLVRTLQGNWEGDPSLLNETARSLNTLLDLDLAIIEDAYQAEYASRLQRAERLATLGQVAGGVAHELRNPLNVVKTSVYYLLNARNPTPEKTAEHLKRIERQVELADGVITTLSNFARMPVPSLRPTPVEPCVREALEAYPPGRRHPGPGRPPGVAAAGPGRRRPAPDRLRQPDPQRPRRHGRRAGGSRSRASQVDGAVEVAVADTGAGIPAADLARILEPLYSTKARGLGLGLAIVRAILDKSGGGLRVESEPGRGSVFTVRLTAAPAPQGDGVVS